jgi:hypothetical protein
VADETQANSTSPDTTTTAPAQAPPQSATVTAPAPDQVATQDAPQSTATIQPAAAPDANAAPMGATLPQDPLAKRIFHGIMGALGGTEDTSYARDPNTGKMVVTQTASGTGTQWKRIIAGAVSGTAAGLGASPGPGQLERAASAGFQTSQQMVSKQDDQQRQHADQDFSTQQKATLQKAQTQLLTYQTSEAAFRLQRMGVEAHQMDADRENQFVKSIQAGGNGSQDLGVAKDFKDVLAMHKDMPDLYKENAQGNIIATSHVDGDGKFDGMRYALVTPQWKDANTTEDQSFFHLVPATKVGEQPTIQKQTVKAGTIKNGAFANQQAAAAQEIMKWQTEAAKEKHQNTIDASTVAKNRAETAKAYAETAKTNRETANLKAPDGASDSDIVKGMLDGSIDITKTASIRGNRREQLIAQAKQQDPKFNMQDYGTKLKVRQDFADGKASQQLTSFNAFLGHADDYSQTINDLRNSHSPLINKPLNWLKKNAEGNPAIQQVLIAQSAVKTEFQNFLNNNHALMAQDKEEGEKMLDENVSPAAAQAAMKQFITTASIRMSALNHTYYRTFGTDAPDMLDEDGKASLAHFGVPESMVYHHPTGTATPNTSQAARQPAAAAPAFNWGDHPVAQ